MRTSDAEPADTPASSQVRKIDAPEAAPVDLGRVAGGAVAKRLVPLAIGAIVLIGLVVWLVTK